MPRGIPAVRQRDATDCGAACLASVAAHFGYRLPLARVRQYAGTDRRGTTVLGMVEAAERLGFTARGVRGPFESLFRVPTPAVAHLVVGEGLHHFVVVYGVDPAHVTVMDPAEGQVRRVPHDDFRAQWTGVLVLLVPGRRFRPGDERTPLPARLWTLVRPHRPLMAQALVGAVFYTLLGLSTAVYVQKIVDRVLVDGDRALLDLMSAAMLALLLAQAYLGTMKGLFTLRAGQKIDGVLILDYHRHLMRLPQRFFDSMRVGEIVSRVNDAVKIRAFINDVALALLVDALVVAFSLALLVLYGGRLALLALASIPLFGALYWGANRLNRATQRRLMEDAAEVESQLVESLETISTTKRFGLEWYGHLRTEVRIVRLLRTAYRSGVNSLSAEVGAGVVSRLLTVALLWAGSVRVLGGDLTPGELMSCYTLLAYLTGPVSSLVASNRTVQDALIAADRLFEILDLEPEETDEAARKVELTPEMVGDIRFVGVSFRYGTGTPVFEDLSLVIPKGKLTAVVGGSGCGKSTLLSLLQNLYPLDRGRILVGEVELGHVSNASLRARVAAVPQRIDLLAGSVLENIAVGDLEPDVRRVLEVAGRAGVAEFAERLPRGFHTPLGENGATLSGGERQRVAIARALYRDPEVLVLDEATSSLDSSGERQVREALRELRARGTTVVVVAHRLSSVRSADKIVVLAGGRVAEEGTHAELLRRGGEYSRLWRDQHPPPEPGEEAGSLPPDQAALAQSMRTVTSPGFLTW